MLTTLLIGSVLLNVIFVTFLLRANAPKGKAQEGGTARRPFDLWIGDLYRVGRRSGSIEDLIQEYIRTHRIRTQRFIDEDRKIIEARTKVAVLEECDRSYLEVDEISLYYRTLLIAVSGYDRAKIGAREQTVQPTQQQRP